MRNDCSINFHLTKLSIAKFSILYDISLVRGWKRKLRLITLGSERVKTKLRAPRCLNNISFSARAQCPSTGTESGCGLRFPSPPITFHWWGNNTGNKLSKILLQGSEYNTCPNTFFSDISTAWYTKYSNQNKTQPHKKHFKRMQTFNGGCWLLSGCRDKTW